MKCSRLNSDHGMTLVELLVALGLSSIVMTAMIHGVLFMQRQLQSWSDTTRWFEEMSFARSGVTEIISRSVRTKVFADSIVCEATGGARNTICWRDSILAINGRPLLRQGTRVKFLSVAEVPMLFPNGESVEVVNQEGRRSLRISVVMSDPCHASIEVTFIVREVYEYSKPAALWRAS